MWRFFRATVRPHSVNTVRFEHKATKRKRRSTPTSISTEATPAHLRYQPTTVSMSALQLLLAVALLHTLCAPQCHAACVEVDSDTEAVAGQGFKLGCISCKMRGEVPATASVDWYFMAKQGTEFDHIYNYEDETATIMDQRFEDRLDWNGSKKTNDLQDGSIYILNVTYNDSGVYQCLFKRTLTFPFYEFNTNATKIIHINVVAKATRGMASILSEVMMYVSIIGLQLWLVVEMVYCYRKIAAAGEEALRESAAEYLAIASESKDNCAGVQVAE
ncbi:sodium channel subunit beta-1-like isoform X1 [Arapaima gigas]